jgi:chromosome segregation ATPase
MEESIKNRVILILAILTAIFFIGTVGSCSNVSRLKVARDKEMAQRLEVEEKINKFVQEKSAVEEKLSTATQALEEEKAAHQATKKALLQEELVNQSLKEELQKVTKLKEALEEDLKEALVSGKSKLKK